MLKDLQLGNYETAMVATEGLVLFCFIRACYFSLWLKKCDTAGVLGKGVPPHAHALVHASQHWEVRVVARLFIKEISCYLP